MGIIRIPRNIKWKELLESYSIASQVNYLNFYPGSWLKWGTAFTLTEKRILTSASFYLRKVNSPTGTAYVRLYAATGTVGSTAYPTGSVLATFGTIDVSMLTSTSTKYKFTPGTRYEASAGNYCIGIEYANGTTSNYLQTSLGSGLPPSGNCWGYRTSYEYNTSYNSCGSELFAFQ